jgi:hypothetical protein
MFLAWHSHARDKTPNLKYLFASNIENAETNALIARATRFKIPGDGEHMPCEHRRVFYPHSDAYNALIASPNGRSAALMMVRQKAFFGQRTVVESVTVWYQQDGSWEPSLLFAYRNPDPCAGAKGRVRHRIVK